MIVFQSSAIAESASHRPCYSPSPGGEGWGEGELNSKPNPQNSTSPSIPYSDKPTSQFITEIEAQHLREKSGTVVPPVLGSKPETSLPPASEKVPESNDDTNRPIAVPSPWGEGQGEGELNSKLKTQNSSLSPTPYKNKTNSPIRPISQLPLRLGTEPSGLNRHRRPAF